jgi:3-dehydroquinate dehydratase
MGKYDSLIERLRNCAGCDNELDIDVDIALFRPDKDYKSVRHNAAKTKLVFTMRDGGNMTHWADDHTLTYDAIDTAIHRLTELEE